MSQKPHQALHQRRCTDGEQANEKMLHIICHQEKTHMKNSDATWPWTCQHDRHPPRTARNRQCCWGCGSTITHLLLVVMQSLWKTVWQLLTTLKLLLPCSPLTTLLGMCPEGVEVWLPASIQSSFVQNGAHMWTFMLMSFISMASCFQCHR